MLSGMFRGHAAAGKPAGCRLITYIGNTFVCWRGMTFRMLSLQPGMSIKARFNKLFVLIFKPNYDTVSLKRNFANYVQKWLASRSLLFKLHVECGLCSEVERGGVKCAADYTPIKHNIMSTGQWSE